MFTCYIYLSMIPPLAHVIFTCFFFKSCNAANAKQNSGLLVLLSECMVCSCTLRSQYRNPNSLHTSGNKVFRQGILTIKVLIAFQCMAKIRTPPAPIYVICHVRNDNSTIHLCWAVFVFGPKILLLHIEALKPYSNFFWHFMYCSSSPLK